MTEDTNEVSKNNSYIEFMIPYDTPDSNGTRYITIDYNVTDWFHEKYFEGYVGEEYPPANEDVCRDLTRHFSKNYNFYFDNGLVRDAYDDDLGVYSSQDLQQVLENNGDIRFIY